MADETIKSLAVKIALDNGTFKQGMNELKSQMGVIDSEFKSSISGIKDWGNNLDGLKSNAAALGDKLNVQKQIVQKYEEQLQKSKDALQVNSEKLIDVKGKVDSTRNAYEQSVTTLGKNNEQTQKLKSELDNLENTYTKTQKAVLNNEKSVQGYTIQLNNAKGALNTMDSELKTVTGDIDKMEKSQTLAGKATEKLGLNSQNLKTAFGTVGIAAGSYLKDCIKESGEAENANKNLEQTIKSTGMAAGITAKEAENLASSYQKQTTFADDAIESGEAMLLTFTNIGKNVFPQATQAMLDMSQKMGTEPQQTAIQLGKALNDPVKGITALTRVGVTFSQQQKDVIANLVKTGDTAGAQKIILSELNKEFGGQATAAAQTFEGQQKVVKNTLNETTEQIGTALIPVLAQIGKAIVPIITSISSFIQQNPQMTAAILAIVAVIGTLVGGLSVINTVMSTFNLIMGASIVPTTAAGTAAAGASVGFGALILPIALVIAGIATVAAVAFVIVKNWGAISGFFTGLWNGIKSGVSTVGNAIKSAFDGAKSGITAGWNGTAAFFTSLWNGIKAGATAAWNGIKAAVMVIITPFVQGIMNIWNSMSDGIMTIFNGIQTYFTGIWNVIKTIFLGAILLIIDLFTGNFTKLSQDAQSIFGKLKEAFSQIWDGIKLIFTGALDAIKGFVSTVWSGIVNITKDVWNGLKSFLSSLWGGIKSLATSIWDGIRSFFAAFWNVIVQGWKNDWNGFINFFKSLPATFMNDAKAIGNAIKSGFEAAVNFIKNLPSEALQWGKDIIMGIVSGIKAAAKAVGNAVNGVAQDIRKFLHFSVPDEGPLVDFESWMPDFMQGLADGINSSKHLVTKALTGLTSDIALSFPATLNVPNINTALLGGNGSSNINNSKTLIQHTTINASQPMSPAETAKASKKELQQAAFSFGF